MRCQTRHRHLAAQAEGHDVVTWQDVIKAKQLKDLGPPENVEYIERERHAVAVHEACHAVAAYHLRKHMTIDLATNPPGAVNDENTIYKAGWRGIRIGLDRLDLLDSQVVEQVERILLDLVDPINKARVTGTFAIWSTCPPPWRPALRAPPRWRDRCRARRR